MRGKFIVLEGPDGSGKTTQVARLAARLAAQGIAVKTIREPGGTALSEKVRSLILDFRDDPPVARAETLLFLAARAQVAARAILPALEKGEWVVCDRFVYSTVAYQGCGRGLGVDAIAALNAFAVPPELVPDAVVFIDVPLETTLARLAIRQGQAKDNIEAAGRAFHERVRASFLQQAKSVPGAVLVDGTKSLDEVGEAVWKSVKHLISQDSQNLEESTECAGSVDSARIL